MNISCVAFTCLQVPWKLLKCKRNNIIIYLSSSTCSLQRKEEKNTCAPIQSQCKHHALFLKSESTERGSNNAGAPDHLLNVQGSFSNYHAILKGRSFYAINKYSYFCLHCHLLKQVPLVYVSRNILHPKTP